MVSQASSTPPLDGPVTLAVSRCIQPGREAEFEAWIAGINQAVRSFEGHHGIGVIRPAPDGPREYVLVFRFDSSAALQRWQTSPERLYWLERLEGLLAGEPRETVSPGLEFWFTPPGAAQLRTPPRWKMVLLTVLGLFPLSALLNLWLLPALLGELPDLLRILVASVVVVSLMTYAVMPTLTRLFARWLERGPADSKAAALDRPSRA
ncbi:hypothetical protein HNR42_002552 [Deinobacterium chartae]|uniref:ABM domain-containing protein n=1 Tax=Deinobacterium chartae TaxID=521158 RepID=A0A841I231_9DEIO|nr:antibiotic biosynthesis monooxygenase [Deinobacterium chartae]MBB6099116.1 hypothetical protein [Deinobacterium chartae]